MATRFAMLSTEGGFPRRTSWGEAGRVQTHSGYQPLKNNIKGRTKNTDSIISKGRELGPEAGQRGREAGLGAMGKSLPAGSHCFKERESPNNPSDGVSWDQFTFSLFPYILSPPLPSFPKSTSSGLDKLGHFYKAA